MLPAVRQGRAVPAGTPQPVAGLAPADGLAAVIHGPARWACVMSEDLIDSATRTV
jgi:hypothetical protein